MAGHRRISNELFLAAVRGKRRFTKVEMLLSYDMDVWLKNVKSIRSYSRIWGCTERTAKAVIQAYEDHAQQLFTEQHFGQHGEQRQEQHQQQREEQHFSLEKLNGYANHDSTDSSTDSSTDNSAKSSTSAALLRTEPDPETEPEKKPKKSRASRGPTMTTFPDDIGDEARAELREWALNRGIDDAFRENAIEACRDWALGKAAKKADWPATIRNWLRRAWVDAGNELLDPDWRDDLGRTRSELRAAMDAATQRRPEVTH